MTAGTNPVALDRWGRMPLMMCTGSRGFPIIAAFLLRLPAFKATIDHIDQDQWSVLSCASWDGR